MKEKTIAEKIEFVDKILSATENIRTYRYFKDILIYMNKLKHENDKLCEANIKLVDELQKLKEMN